MPNNAGVLRKMTNMATVAQGVSADTTIAAAGEAIAVAALYISHSAAGTFAFTNAAGTVTFFSVALPAAGQVAIPLPHPFFLAAGEGGFRVDVPATGSAQVTVWYQKESIG